MLVEEEGPEDQHGANGRAESATREKPRRRNRLVSVTKARRADKTTEAEKAPPPKLAPDEPVTDGSAALFDRRPDAVVIEVPAPEIVDTPRTVEVIHRSAPPVVDTPPSEVTDRSAPPVVDTPPSEVTDRSAPPGAHPAARRVAGLPVREPVEATSPQVVDEPTREVVDRSEREVVDRPHTDVDRPARDVVGHPAPSEAPPAAASAAPSTAPQRQRRDAMHLVRELLDRSDELFVYHLGVVAQVIVEDVTENLPADAACVLVRDDDGRWHVEGAAGLRETETRLVLDDDHWLVAQTVRSGAAVAIEDTDIARNQLRGAPLASWPHLMAEGTPDGRALIIAARDVSGEGFTERDVVRIAELCQEGQRYLVAGQELRTLVRRLSED